MRLQPRRRSPTLGRVVVALVLLGTAVVAPHAGAQQVFRHVDGNGKVTFSDQPGAADARAASSVAGARADSGASAAGLPYELRQVVQRYPVVLYTRDDCGPCDTGRALLTSRGVPHTERQIRTPEDSEAFLKLSGEDSLPLLSVGSQQLKGFSDTTWSQYLDAAGYPKSVQLPAGYRNPAPQPLVTRSAASPSPSAAAPPPPIGATSLPPIPPDVSGPTPGNPAGIRF